MRYHCLGCDYVAPDGQASSFHRATTRHNLEPIIDLDARRPGEPYTTTEAAAIVRAIDRVHNVLVYLTLAVVALGVLVWWRG